MAIQTINIGNRVNDGLGDDLRTAFEKVNANFTDLSTQLSVTGANIGDVGAGVYKQNTGGTLEFRKLVAGSKIVIDENDNNIAISSNAEDAFTRFVTDSGEMLASVHKEITVQGTAAPNSYSSTKDIEVTTQGSSVLFKTIIPVTEVLTTFDFGPIDGDYEYSTQLSLAASNIDFGTLAYPSRLNLDAGSIL